MKKKLQKILNEKGYRLESCRFGIYGDWCVVTDDGVKYFTTLGMVRQFAESI